MRAIMCDSCGKILKEKDVVNTYLESGMRRAEVCKECEEKIAKINKEFSIKNDELNKKYEIFKEEYKNKLKEIGIEF